jgi:hypothetical protein
MTKRRDRRATALLLLVLVALVAAAAYASSGLAAQPKGPGCWAATKAGCASRVGPVGGLLQVSGGTHSFVYEFADSQKCLGVANGLFNELLITKSLSVDKAGNFKFSGKTSVVAEPAFSVSAKLAGRFVTPTLAKITLTIAYKKCGTVHLTLHP